MNRRYFVTLLSGTVAAWPIAARAQQPTGMRRLGVLLADVEGDPPAVAELAAFEKALRDFGWADGRNIRIDKRWGAVDVVRIKTLAKELIQLRPDVILGASTSATAALHGETRTIPIVFVAVSDPVGSGFVASLPRPGGNSTGFINIEGSLGGKWIEMLKDIEPGIRRAALLFNPETATYFEYYQQSFEAAARSSAIEPITAAARTAGDIERIVTSLGKGASAGLVVTPDTSMRRNRDLIVSLAARYRVPTIYSSRSNVAAGGLISYGIDQTDLYRRAATYVDRILKGAKPADLPVQLPTKFELAVNLKTAQALGLNLSREFLLLADEVIE